ncbi:helical backbone metal receptor [Psychrobacillus sp. FSL K6-2365]|uniref:ABC transporter substrate-binding protein n=1 Tax=Psychrobacillus TaxID=1221880 RepID=UPI0008EBE11B|nr:helical backbone metal receptor [Psychrobacillus psychrodurans]MCZ8541698.1 helical backbone metal receptor [Psychrobacillus psychrodurans]SFN08758.1 ABC-type Fe3+-hydroxamate transport system, substrate-binding protein [Psychrobacillus psychrodurans]
MTYELTDHLGRKVVLPESPKRIISICPAITETLFSLGLEKEIVGRTKYCIFPKGIVDQVQIVGGTKEINFEKVKEIQPDLIFAEKEENTEEIVLELEKIAPVFVLEVKSIQNAYRFITTLGEVTATTMTAKLLLTACQKSFQSIKSRENGKATYVIWRKPYMVVGGTTYINDVLQVMGFENPFTNEESRYPTVTNEQLTNANLDKLFLASEPFPFQQKHLAEFQAFLPNTEIILVDGEMFWYGSRMLVAGEYLAELVNN